MPTIIVSRCDGGIVVSRCDGDVVCGFNRMNLVCIRIEQVIFKGKRKCLFLSCRINRPDTCLANVMGI